ncbi:MAG: tRNA (guanosine(46)-N7)-methyltransferase TrmB [Proteobacteria bacterium]|nr:tRNA (guanosine(46)-N7)-methyltransferase TrmB [Pseudomonadota bacterium]
MPAPRPTAISAARRTRKAASAGKKPISPTSSNARSELSERPERQRRLLYGRRKGPKLSAHQQHLLETLLPQLTLHLKPGADPRSYFLPLPRGEVEICGTQISGEGKPHHFPSPKKSLLRSDFSTSPQGRGDDEIKDVWLEIGFGAGEHLHWQAENHPHIGIIGAEPFVNGVAKLLSKFVEVSRNIRIHMGDARDVIAALPDASLGRVFILFPDPWPKTRHHKRRFIQTETLDQLARVMRKGAELRFASDDAPYLEWTLERLLAHPRFAWTATCAADWRSRTPDWPQTRYEAKQLHGTPAFLRFVRR